MKFTGALSTLLVILPCLVLQVSAAPPVLAREPKGGNGGGQGGKGNAKAVAASAGAGAVIGAGVAGVNNAAGDANGTAATGAANATATDAAGAGGDPQTSLTLDPSVICTNCKANGLGNGSEAGQVASLTSDNNFINFCAGQTITNGQQIKTGSCNPTPQGQVPATTNMPSSKFVSPTNMQNIQANTAFTITMAVSGLDTGNFVNPNTNYFAAPQQVDGTSGNIIGHSHVVIEQLDSLNQTKPTNPAVFAFFVGLNAEALPGSGVAARDLAGGAANLVLTANVDKGLGDGVYRLASINTAANHQPALVAVAQHGSLDDMIYFTVGDTGAANAAANQAADADTGAAAKNGTAAGGAGTGTANVAGAPDAAAGTKDDTGATDAKGAGGNNGAADAKGAGGNNGAADAKGAGGNNGAADAKGAGANNAAADKGADDKGGKRRRRSFKIARQN